MVRSQNNLVPIQVMSEILTSKIHGQYLLSGLSDLDNVLSA